MAAAPKPRKGNRNADKRERSAQADADRRAGRAEGRKAASARRAAAPSTVKRNAAPGATSRTRGTDPARPPGAASTGRAGAASTGRAGAASTGRAGAASTGRAGAASTGRARPGGATTGPRRAGDRRSLGGDQVEGRQAVRELLLAGRRRVHELWLASETDDPGPLQDLADLAEDVRVPVRLVSRHRLDANARTEAPQGVLARADPLEEVDLDDLAKPGPAGTKPFLVAVDGVTDPGNLGALLRSAECTGVTGVVLPRHRSVHVTPTVTKSAAGAIEHLPMAVVGGLPAALERLKAAGVWSIGLDGAGETRIDQVDLAGQPVVLVLGAEGSGLSRLVRQRCDVVAAIPLLGSLGSLNVSAAGAIACYEVARRRLDAAG